MIARLAIIGWYGNPKLVDEIQHVFAVNEHAAADRHLPGARDLLFEQIEQMQNIYGGPPCQHLRGHCSEVTRRRTSSSVPRRRARQLYPAP